MHTQKKPGESKLIEQQKTGKKSPIIIYNSQNTLPKVKLKREVLELLLNRIQSTKARKHSEIWTLFNS